LKLTKSRKTRVIISRVQQAIFISPPPLSPDSHKQAREEPLTGLRDVTDADIGSVQRESNRYLNVMWVTFPVCRLAVCETFRRRGCSEEAIRIVGASRYNASKEAR